MGSLKPSMRSRVSNPSGPITANGNAHAHGEDALSDKLKVFKVDNFDADNYLQLKCQSMNEKVILVGHSFGGACISYAMECFPKKIAKAVFVTATMVKDGQRAFDAFVQEMANTNDLIQDARVFIYANGNDKPPTRLEFDRNQLRELFFNQRPTKKMLIYEPEKEVFNQWDNFQQRTPCL